MQYLFVVKLIYFVYNSNFRQNTMNYLNIYGSYQEQTEQVAILEKEIFLRKIILLCYLSEKLKENNILLYLKVDSNYKKISFQTSKDDFPKKNRDNIYGFLLNIEEYGLESEFIEENNIAINSMIFFEEKFDYDSSQTSKSNNFFIEKEKYEWIKLICDSCEKPDYYPYFMHKILKDNLPENPIKKELNKI